MIILRVAMGRGWRKETVKEINTTLVFAAPTTARVHEQSQEVHVTIYDRKDPISGLETPTDASTRTHVSATGTDPLV
jgi:hypothetical protein